MKPLGILLTCATLALSSAGCSIAADDAATSDAELRASEARTAYEKLRSEARQLAGAPADIAQRAIFLHEIFEDSRGNHAFPEVALHGALWAADFFRSKNRIEGFVGEVGLSNLAPIDFIVREVNAFGDEVLATNREVFIDTYVLYFFTKRFGRRAEATAIVGNPALVEQMNAMHEATARGEELDARAKRDLFLAALSNEQESTVAKRMEAAAREITPLLRPFVMRLIVDFEYFPAGRRYFFRNFSDKNDRIRCATECYDLAVEAGWPRVAATMAGYGIIPEAYFSDRAAYAKELRARLLR